MKRSFFSFILFGLSLFVVGISIWRSRMPAVTLAVEPSLFPEEQTLMAIDEAVTEKEEYPLPYPGLLPDHPLYFLKMARDRIQLWFTRKPLDQAKLLLHYADKRIAASLALAEKGKVGLAASTATKAEKYLEQALEAARVAQSRGEDTRDFYHQLLEATEKHEKVLMGVLSRTPDEVRTAIESAVDSNEQSHDAVEAEVEGDKEDELEDEDDSSTEILEDSEADEETEDREGVEIRDSDKEEDLTEDEGKG